MPKKCCFVGKSMQKFLQDLEKLLQERNKNHLAFYLPFICIRKKSASNLCSREGGAPSPMPMCACLHLSPFFSPPLSLPFSSSHTQKKVFLAFFQAYLPLLLFHLFCYNCQNGTRVSLSLPSPFPLTPPKKAKTFLWKKERKDGEWLCCWPL